MISRVPLHFHFIYGLREQEEPFHIVHYLCILSCLEKNKPGKIYLYYHYEPYGEYWDKVKKYVTLVKINKSKFINKNIRLYKKSQEGNFILYHDLVYAHHTDFLRIEILHKKGGVYADMDTIFVKKMPDEFYSYPFVMGEEGYVGEAENRYYSLCNALMLSEKNSRFANLWLKEMKKNFDGEWNSHSCRTAGNLSGKVQNEIHILPRKYFYKFLWTKEDFKDLFERKSGLEDVYSIHLWAHLWWDEWRTDFSNFHNGLITKEYIANFDSTYAEIARNYLNYL